MVIEDALILEDCDEVARSAEFLVILDKFFDFVTEVTQFSKRSVGEVLGWWLVLLH